MIYKSKSNSKILPKIFHEEKILFIIIVFYIITLNQFTLADTTLKPEKQLKLETPFPAPTNSDNCTNNQNTPINTTSNNNSNQPADNKAACQVDSPNNSIVDNDNSLNISSLSEARTVQIQNNTNSNQNNTFKLHASNYALNAPSDPNFWLKTIHPEFALRAQKSVLQILEVKGGADTIAPLLSQMSVLFKQINVDELLDCLSAKTKVLAIDCCGMPDKSDHLVVINNTSQSNNNIKPIPQEDWPAIRQWIKNGGYLLATDWTLDNFLSHAFPGYLSYQGNNDSAGITQRLPKGQYRSIFGQTVNNNSGSLFCSLRTLDVMFLKEGLLVPVETTDLDPALLNGTKNMPHNWALAGCLGVKIENPNRVKVLVQPMPIAPYPVLGAIACEFSYGNGHVLYLAGHFCDKLNGLNWQVIRMDLKTALFTNYIILGLESNLE